MNISLLKFRIVELLQQHKKITAVADLLGLKQPTVTFHMKNMEQELGVQLFESRSGKTYLTEAGHALHHYAIKINALAHEAERVVKEFDVLGRGTLKLGASYVPGTYMLPAILSSFARSYPQIRISLSVKTSPVIKEMLVNHEIDLGILSTEPFQFPPLLNETICEDELVVILSPKHRLARHQQLYPDLLADVPFVLHSAESSTRHMTDKWAQSNRVSLRTQLELDSLEAIKQAVILGESIAFISKLAVRSEVDRGELEIRPIPQNMFKRYVYLAYNQDRKQSTLLQKIIGHIRLSTP
ncbi:HTH-type transcriptional activator CmpR [compost metagenome]